jgi:hypothetical protein
MFKRSRSYAVSGKVDPERFIENINDVSDLANSDLLYKLDQEMESRRYYEITRYEYRIDLIAREIYGDIDYSWILMYINRLDVTDLVRGRKIQYIPPDILDEIISLA